MRNRLTRSIGLTAFVLCGVIACGSGTSTGGTPPPEPQPTGAPTGGDCATSECLRANTCKKADCTGNEMNTGCCACPAGYVDAMMCADAATQKTDCAPAC